AIEVPGSLGLLGGTQNVLRVVPNKIDKIPIFAHGLPTSVDKPLVDSAVSSAVVVMAVLLMPAWLVRIRSHHLVLLVNLCRRLPCFRAAQMQLDRSCGWHTRHKPR